MHLVFHVFLSVFFSVIKWMKLRREILSHKVLQDQRASFIFSQLFFIILGVLHPPNLGATFIFISLSHFDFHYVEKTFQQRLNLIPIVRKSVVDRPIVVCTCNSHNTSKALLVSHINSPAFPQRKRAIGKGLSRFTQTHDAQTTQINIITNMNRNISTHTQTHTITEKIYTYMYN